MTISLNINKCYNVRLAARGVEKDGVLIAGFLLHNHFYCLLESIWVELLSMGEILRVTKDVFAHFQISLDAFADGHAEPAKHDSNDSGSSEISVSAQRLTHTLQC